MYLADGTLLQGGKYKIVRHISSGGFGNTYEALDVNLDKRVAIKEFFVKDFCSRESDTTLVTIASTAKKPLIEHQKKKFIEEARAIAKMEHENIVKVQALFEENGTAYYVMDYIDGESLSTLLKRRGSLPENEALPIILKVADALGYMHKQNRFHLDVKPANIMIRKDGKVILIDFGSSKQYAEVDGENTTTLAPCYTTGYAPSEQMNPKPTAFTAATDVYALGATLYKMLTSQTPPSAIDLLNGGDTLSPLTQEISHNVKECVEKSMIPQRNKRMQSVEEFKLLLGGKINNEETLVHPTESKDIERKVLSEGKDANKERSNYTTTIYTILVFILIGLSGICFYFSRPPQTSSVEGFPYIDSTSANIDSPESENVVEISPRNVENGNYNNSDNDKTSAAATESHMTNKKKIVDAFRIAEAEYSRANSEDDLNKAEAKLKSKTNEIQGNCTVNELKEIVKDAEYNQAWKDCMQAYMRTAERLGL